MICPEPSSKIRMIRWNTSPGLPILRHSSLHDTQPWHKMIKFSWWRREFWWPMAGVLLSDSVRGGLEASGTCMNLPCPFWTAAVRWVVQKSLIRATAMLWAWNQRHSLYCLILSLFVKEFMISKANSQHLHLQIRSVSSSASPQMQIPRHSITALWRKLGAMELLKVGSLAQRLVLWCTYASIYLSLYLSIYLSIWPLYLIYLI
jgi:hypothetical protein